MDNEKLEQLVPELLDSATRSRAFSALVKATQSRLYWHIRKMVLVHDDANDVLQNTYIKVWRGLESFRADSRLFTWIYRIATNETLTFLAQQRMRNITSPIEVEELILSRMEADVYYEGDDLNRKFQAAVMSLPEKQRLVFNMKYYDDLKYSEISEITGTSEGALKASYHFAVEKIEKFIKDND